MWILTYIFVFIVVFAVCLLSMIFKVFISYPSDFAKNWKAHKKMWIFTSVIGALMLAITMAIGRVFG